MQSMRSLFVALALGLLASLSAVAPAAPASAVDAQACDPWPATILGSRSGTVTVAPTVECRDEGVRAGTTPAPPPRVGTGIAGSVRRGPIRPVCVAGLACDGPAAGVVVEVDSARTAVARLRTGEDGRFLVRVPPGVYVVRVVAERVAPVAVRVRVGVFSRVSLSIDTGIR
jgi:hypothetical protein